LANKVNSSDILIALGANEAGAWGAPRETFDRAIEELSFIGVFPLALSRLYSTRPVGHGLQPRYLNAVLRARSNLAPAALLRALKAIERKAGRRLGRHWGPRPLDLDILDYRGRRAGWPSPTGRPRGHVVLPHPEMHKRAFVLAPLLDVAPAAWRHPVFRRSAGALLGRLPGHERLGVEPLP
jgi:2-amino-4-hydroxy-6-hydroxymethyldihydropteridine diphosphokinase